MMQMRAVIYARCSTEEESQKDALAKQAAEAKESVEKQGWILADSYIESRSGTSTKGRTEYQRLYENLSEDKFDIIVIKSQDRLMRNTKDWYLFVDRLMTFQKRLYIYIEQKFYSTDDGLITGLKAILAEDYSRELSKKINNAHHNRQKTGSTVLLTNNTYGYKKLPDKSVVLEEGEAKVKRRMYELCAAGYGSRTIAKILKEEGIVNRRGNPFGDGDIRRMIRNPLNKGTVVMHRVHYDFDSKRTMKIPEEEQYRYDHRVPAIVSEQLWQLANEKISQRAESVNKNTCCVKGINPGRTKLSRKLYCGLCGAPFYRTTRRAYKDGKKIQEWSCRTYLQSGKKEKTSGCDNIHLQEKLLYEVLQSFCMEQSSLDRKKIFLVNEGKLLFIEREKVIRKMLRILENVFHENESQLEIERSKQACGQVEMQMRVLLEKLLTGVVSNEIYQMKQKELERSRRSFQEKQRSLEEKQKEERQVSQRLTEIEDFMKNGDGIKRAMLAGMLEKIQRIEIYPCRMELVGLFSNKIRIDLGNTFQYREQKREERETLVAMMKKNPQITARQISQKLNISLSGANYRIRVLKKEGRIRFEGSGGKGEWKILNPNDSLSRYSE